MPLSDEGGDGDFNNDITLPYFSGDEGDGDDEDAQCLDGAPAVRGAAVLSRRERVIARGPVPKP